MSGGHWEAYNDFLVSETLTVVADDPEVRDRFPEIAAVFRQLAKVLPPIIHALDLDLSDDEKIGEDDRFQQVALEALRDAVGVSDA